MKTERDTSEVGVETLLVKHSSDLSKVLKPWREQNNTGLIGTACVLNPTTKPEKIDAYIAENMLK